MNRESNANGELPWSPASERNREPILKVLQQNLPQAGTVLEIGSGSGQHVVFFEAGLPDLQWQPTERDSELPGLQARVAQEGGSQILPPLPLDVLCDPWPHGQYCAAFSANTAHIMSWEAVKAMFAGVGNCLTANAPFLLYGPFRVDGRFTTDSNRRFDETLRLRDVDMGVRDMGELESLAGRHQMKLERRIEMPANNFTLVFRKELPA